MFRRQFMAKEKPYQYQHLSTAHFMPDTGLGRFIFKDICVCVCRDQKTTSMIIPQKPPTHQAYLDSITHWDLGLSE